MPTRGSSFSVYDLIDQHNVHNIAMEQRAMLAHFSHRIETDILSLRLTSPVYAGFQKLDYAPPVLARYRRMAATGVDVWLFGEANQKPLDVAPCRTIILEPDDALAREWFLVVHDPLYSRALVAREISQNGQTNRLFAGVITSDLDEVRGFAQALAAFVTTPVTTRDNR